MQNFDEIEVFTMVNEEGIEVEMQVIVAFQSETTNKHYVVFTSGEMDEDGDIEMEVASYNPEAEDLELLAIDDLAEKDLIETEIDKMIEIEYTDDEFDEVEEIEE